jgi:hypothetical protein
MADPFDPVYSVFKRRAREHAVRPELVHGQQIVEIRLLNMRWTEKISAGAKRGKAGWAQARPTSWPLPLMRKRLDSLRSAGNPESESNLR